MLEKQGRRIIERLWLQEGRGRRHSTLNGLKYPLIAKLIGDKYPLTTYSSLIRALKW